MRNFSARKKTEGSEGRDFFKLIRVESLYMRLFSQIICRVLKSRQKLDRQSRLANEFHKKSLCQKCRGRKKTEGSEGRDFFKLIRVESLYMRLFSQIICRVLKARQNYARRSWIANEFHKKFLFEKKNGGF